MRRLLHRYIGAVAGLTGNMAGLRFFYAGRLVQYLLKNESSNDRVRANMNIPLGTNRIGVRQGFNGFNKKSSTFCHTIDVDGLSALFAIYNNKYF